MTRFIYFNIKGLIIILSLFYVFILCGVTTSICYAQQEQITITTYYPSPFGSYQDLQVNNNFTAANAQVNRLAIGPGNNPLVINNGVLDFVGMSPHPVGANAGSIYYNSAQNAFFYHNGTTWQPLMTAARLVLYTLNNPSPCQPTGTHVVAVLNMNRRGASFTSPPANGYVVCH